ncbi:MAG: GNAT family N-acetyltransferase [Erysipelotrichaceae bacterium]|nr:GNAT family N-acetyltransferase [Erysipelotrichaceae bacterium]
MDHFTDERDQILLENDRYTFFVLRRIIEGDCTLLLSDHEKLILCFSCDPFPVWIWTADDVSKDEMAKAYELAQENGLLDGNHTFNLKYELAQYFIERAAEEGKKYAITINMFAYDCPKPQEPQKKADGHFHPCTMEDLKELVELTDLFHKEVGIDQQSLEQYRLNSIDEIRQGLLFMWKNEEGLSVACCSYRPAGDLASLGLVYTRKQYRRRHYAENLVYQVTRIAKEAGYLPMLYTDADYAASNACYEKVGYILKGKLCTIGKSKE